MEKETSNYLTVLDVVTNNKDRTNLITSAYRKTLLKTFAGLLTNFFNFTSFSYKHGRIRTLLDRMYKINCTFLGFNNEVRKLSCMLTTIS